MAGAKTKDKTRWLDCAHCTLNSSPFGLTEDGRKDFRSIPFAQISKENRLDISQSKWIVNCDFSRADFSSAYLEGLSFENCYFQSCKFEDFYERQCTFLRCRFERSSFTTATLGAHTSSYRECKFEQNRFGPRSSVLNAIFENCDFNNNLLTGLFFSASGFWNCRFTGVIHDVVFLGEHLYPYQRQTYGPPVRSGLHGVDFSNAVLQFVEVRSNCAVEDVVMPNDGSCILVDLDCLQKLANSLSMIHGAALTPLIDNIKFLRETQTPPVGFLSAHAVAEYVGEKIGPAVFAEIRERLEKLSVSQVGCDHLQEGS